MDEDLTAVVIKVEEDDHGHATLMVHGDPEIIMELAKAVTILLAADADQVILPGELDGPEEDLGAAS